MSGSGGGGYGVPGGRSSDCNIVEQLPLNSVQAAVLGQLVVGQELDVVVTNEGQSLAAQLTPNGRIAGSLTPQALADLLECMDQGHEYKAVVLKKRGALVEVEIRPR